MPSNVAYHHPGDLPAVIPVFPLAGALLLPRGQMPLNIFEPRYLAMVDDALRTDRLVGMIQPDPEEGGSPPVPRLYRVGCAGRITQFAESGDGRYVIQLTDKNGFREPATKPERYEIQVTPDEPPVVELLSPASDLSVTKNVMVDVAFKTRDDFVRRFASSVDHNVEAAAMAHGDHGIDGAGFAGGVEDGIEQRNQRGDTFERETFGAQIACLQNLFK